MTKKNSKLTSKQGVRIFSYFLLSVPVKQKAEVSPECSVCSTGLTILKFVVGQNATEVNIILAPGLHNSFLASRLLLSADDLCKQFGPRSGAT